MSLGYHSNTGPSESSSPSFCRYTMLLEIAFVSTSISEWRLASPSISFHATSAVHVDPNGPPLLSQPDISAEIVISIVSSSSTMNELVEPRSTSNSSWSKLQLLPIPVLQASALHSAWPIDEPPALTLIVQSTDEPLGPTAFRNKSIGR